MNIQSRSQEAISERLQQLTLRFLERCIGDVGVMRECAAQIREGVDSTSSSEDIDLSPLRQLEHLAHRIHGTGASFGCGVLSERGGAVERFVERLIQIETPLDKAACDELDRLIARLCGELDEVTAQHGLR